MGIESFTTTGVFYFIIAANFHSISTFNLAVKELTLTKETEKKTAATATTIKRRPATTATITRPTTDEDDYELAINDYEDEVEDDYDDGGDESCNENNDERREMRKRYLTIDYRKRKYIVSVLFPVFFIWFLAGSVSLPVFIFSNVIPNENNPRICGIINFNENNNLLMQFLVILIRILVPTICLFLTTINVISKIYQLSVKKYIFELEENVGMILKLSLTLSITFAIFSLQKIYGSLLFEILAEPYTNYKYPELNEVYSIGFCMIFYSICLTRPIIYVKMQKKLREKIRKMCCCCSSKRKKTDFEDVCEIK